MPVQTGTQQSTDTDKVDHSTDTDTSESDLALFCLQGSKKAKEKGIAERSRLLLGGNTLKPNIIIFNPDQMRADTLAHLGNPASKTPYLDQFAEKDAVSFRNAFCQNTVCIPSRCSFLTGLYPHVNGHRTMAHMLHEHESTLLRDLKDSGYYVWMNGRNDFLPGQVEGIFDLHASEVFCGGDVKNAQGPKDKNVRGKIGDKNFYSFYFGELETDDEGKNYTIDDECVDKASSFIENYSKEQPFCMFLALQYPHPPYQIEEPYFSAIDKNRVQKRIALTDKQREKKPKMLREIYNSQNLKEFSEEEWNEIRSCYLGMTYKVDDYFRQLCEALKEKGIYDNTAIFFFSDHGDYTGDYGVVEKSQNNFEDCLVNIPLLIKPPKGYGMDPGISESLVELVDIYPTIMELCSVAPTHSHFGKSLLNVLADRNQEHRDCVFAEGGRLENEIHCNETTGRDIRPEYLYYPRQNAQKDHVAHTKATMIRTKDYKYIKRKYETDEFYDLKNDPNECENQIENSKYASLVLDMKQEMLDWYQSTCDIVPFELDQRSNFEITWNRIKLMVPEGEEEVIKNQIRNGKEMFMLIEELRKRT